MKNDFNSNKKEHKFNRGPLIGLTFIRKWIDVSTYVSNVLLSLFLY